MEIPIEEFWNGATISTFLTSSLSLSDANVLKIYYILDNVLTVFYILMYNAYK